MSWWWQNFNRYNNGPLSGVVLSYTNTTSQSIKINYVYIYAGSGQGTFIDPDNTAATITGSGDPFTIQLNSTSTIAVDAVVGEESTASGNIPEYGKTTKTTFNWNKTIGAGETANISVTSTSMTKNQVLVIDKVSSDVGTTYDVVLDSNGATFSDGLSKHQSSVEEGDTITLPTIANMTANKYTVTFNANSGSPNSSKQYSQSLTGWNTKANGTGTSYAPGAHLTIDNNTTLYAIWTNPAVGTLPSPTRSNYVLTTWNTKSDGTGTNISASSVITSSFTCYAIWEGSPFLIKTASGWIPWKSSAHNTNNIANGQSKSSSGWALDKPVYQYTTSGWEQIRRGTKYDKK